MTARPTVQASRRRVTTVAPATTTVAPATTTVARRAGTAVVALAMWTWLCAVGPGARADVPPADEAVQAVTGQAGAQAGAQAVAQAVAVIDLRVGAEAELAGSRAELRAALAGIDGIEVTGDAAVDAALAGDRGGNLAAVAESARAAAAAAYGALDCATAVTESDRALAAYAGLQARGRDVAAPLRQLYAYEFLCAHGRNDADAAMQAAYRLRRLGEVAAPPGVDTLVWSLYPALDATTNAAVVELTVETKPPGATVWFDHQRVGAGPVTVIAGEGEHIAAASLGDRSVGQSVVVTADAGPVVLALPTVDVKVGRLADRVSRWRAAGTGVDGDSLGVLMDEVGVRFAVVMAGGDRVQVWARGPGEQSARQIHATTTASPVEIGAKIKHRARRWAQTGPEPGVELLREKPGERAGADKPGRQRWWVYATIVGALVVGGVVLVASDIADDRQRIQVTIP